LIAGLTGDVDMRTDVDVYYKLLKEFFMPKFIDRTGQKFGRLLVLECAGRNNLKKVMWKCLCDCGGTTVVVAGSIVTGTTVSCGCYLKERITKHGGWKKGSYNTWRAMIRRCNVTTDKDYPRYGALDITVCPTWLDYLNFERDMGEPVGTETLDRIDPYGNYEPSNCRWASITVQNRNLRVRQTNKSGHIGVHRRDNSWYGEITAKGKKFYSKACKTIEEAAAARKQLELLHWA